PHLTSGLTLCGAKLTVSPVTSEEYGAKAKRPYNSRMDRSKLVREGFTPLPEWQDALHRYVEILKAEEE
ncbi:MAG: sugar nucleotide-binding protein, partial [Lachnospiraceae bacterium]